MISTTCHRCFERVGRARTFAGSLVLLLALSVGCGDAETRRSFSLSSGGSGGSGGMTGTGGLGGTMGTGATGGITGTGGVVGTGGTGGESPKGCGTNALCEACPTTTCSTDSDCSFPPGSICVPTGCTFDGEPQKECQPAGYISCDATGSCPSPNTECQSVGGLLLCVRTTSECDEYFEDYDCPLGFSCEDGACVDRRVPCELDVQCPKNHRCFNLQNTSISRFCVSMFRTCNVADDCLQLGSGCVDVDGDGRKECTGVMGGATCDGDDISGCCENAGCLDPSAPVCERPAFTTAICGQFGLCLDNTDCAAGFVCAALWPDGRKECVADTGAQCETYRDCPRERQVCAAPWAGGPPSCQAGTEPP